MTDVLGRSPPVRRMPASSTSPTSRGAGDAVETIEIPVAVNATNRYPIRGPGRQWQSGSRRAVRGLRARPQGQQVLADAGFGGRDP